MGMKKASGSPRRRLTKVLVRSRRRQSMELRSEASEKAREREMSVASPWTYTVEEEWFEW